MTLPESGLRQRLTLGEMRDEIDSSPVLGSPQELHTLVQGHGDHTTGDHQGSGRLRNCGYQTLRGKDRAYKARSSEKIVDISNDLPNHQTNHSSDSVVRTLRSVHDTIRRCHTCGQG